MTHSDYTKNILNIKDENIFFDENCLEIKNINGIETKIFHGKLTYTPLYCECCGCINAGYDDIIKWDWKRNCNVRHTKVCNYNSIILIDKQRFLCKHCHHTFIARSNLVNFHNHISNDVIYSIKLDLMDKISEKDIAKKYNVSHNFVNCIINHLSRKAVLPGPLPTIMNFDEFKATKDTKGKMAFIITNTKTHKVFDILESRKANYIKNYFFRFSRKERLAVKFIIIDLFAPYYNLFKSIFPNATIISDRFHVVGQVNNAFKLTRIQIMKNDKKNYKKLKHYWKLLQMYQDDLDDKNEHYSNHFHAYLTQAEIVEFLINDSPVLKENYYIYQSILKAIKNRDFNLFISIINAKYKYISDYMKKAFKTYIKFKSFIFNSLKYKFNNGVIEGTNNLIKCIKRIAFGYRSFYHFKTRILLITGIYFPA